MVSFSSATWLVISTQVLLVCQLIDTEGEGFLSLSASTWALNLPCSVVLPCGAGSFLKALHPSCCPPHHQPSSTPLAVDTAPADYFNPKRDAATLTTAVASKLLIQLGLTALC